MKDIQCIFCKYKNDEDKCREAVFDYDYHCPTLSNIFYGKIIKFPVIKQIYSICYRIHAYFENKRFEDNYIDENETNDMKFIWGIKSWDDLSCSDVCMYTMNDINLIYHKDKNKYSFSIETIYEFDDEKYKIEYLKGLLQAFTDFMNENGYDTNQKPYYGYVFGSGLDTEFNSIEECYAMFKTLVNGYCGL